jgi:hypothetical protein
MSQAYINQLTINCLVNKDMISKHVNKKQLKKEQKEEIKFYRKRTYNLFKEMINGTIDNNDIIQAEYTDLDKSLTNYGEINYVLDASGLNIQNVVEADKLLMRSVKVDLPPTLDKYVTKTIIQKREADLILPKQKEINLLDPQFKTKGLK